MPPKWRILASRGLERLDRLGPHPIPVLLIAGNLNLGQIINWQTTHGWLILYAPVSFVIFLVSAFAETNRTPFDFAEAEQELVGGYNVEYSSMKFALFPLGEYSAMIVSAGMMVTLFFGGWTLPFWGLDQPAQSLGMGIVHIFVFLANMWVRGGVHLGALDVSAFPV